MDVDWVHHSDYIWLIAAVCLMALETIGFTGAGLMFAGLGALVAGAAVHLGLLSNDAYIIQLITFTVATSLWSYLLWKPLQKFRAGKRSGTYNNIIGDTAYVGSSGINKKTGGEVTWSGTIMKAQLASNVGVEAVEAGSQVEIIEVTGATLIVKPK